MNFKFYMYRASTCRFQMTSMMMMKMIEHTIRDEILKKNLLNWIFYQLNGIEIYCYYRRSKTVEFEWHWLNYLSIKMRMKKKLIVSMIIWMIDYIMADERKKKKSHQNIIFFFLKTKWFFFSIFHSRKKFGNIVDIKNFKCNEGMKSPRGIDQTWILCVWINVILRSKLIIRIDRTKKNIENLRSDKPNNIKPYVKRKCNLNIEENSWWPTKQQ